MAPVKPDIKKYGRNDPCPCLSGLKVKKCCGRIPLGPPGMDFHTTLPLVDTNGPSYGELPGKTIVKVQVARIGGPSSVIPDHSQPVMTYNKGRDRVWSRFLPFAEVEGKMKGRLKVYFYSEIKEGQLVFGDEAPAQGW